MGFKKVTSLLSIILFIGFLALWVYLQVFVPIDSDTRDIFSSSYGILAGIGGIIGFIIANKWNGFKSYVGKSLIFFSAGLMCQFLGQTTYYVQFLIDHIENSYPSWGEIFFFVSMPLYILGVAYIAKASGSGLSWKNTGNKLIAIFIPIIMVIGSYYLFVNGSDFTGQSLIAIILSFAYPIGQAVFVSMAISAYFLSKNVLGGVMKTRVIFILFSLVVQYLADSWFLYKTIQGTFYHADESEYLFALSYSVMTFAFLQFLSVFDQLKKNN